MVPTVVSTDVCFIVRSGPYSGLFLGRRDMIRDPEISQAPGTCHQIPSDRLGYLISGTVSSWCFPLCLVYMGVSHSREALKMVGFYYFKLLKKNVLGVALF